MPNTLDVEVPVDAIREPVDLNLSVSPELYDTLKRLARERGEDLGKVIAKAVALMAVARKAQEEGKKVGAAEKDEDLVQEWVGF